MEELATWQREVLERGRLYLVGGSVRDAILLGRRKDDDYLVTGVPAADLAALLARHGRVDVVGRAFGVIRFLPSGGAPPVDIALPRREVSTGVGHRDFFIDFDPTIPVETDLGRRDFTMNAMAQEIPSLGLIDPFDGRGDIAARRLRIVFPAAFREDPLRMLRAVQFAARFGLTLEAETMARLAENAALAATVSPERSQEEITKLLTLAAAPSAGLFLMRDAGLLPHVLPEVAKTVGVEQPAEWHRYDVFEHTARVCDAAPPENLALRLAALFHDTGKADRRQVIFDEKLGRNRVVFYGHEEVSARDAEAALSRLRYARGLIDRVVALIAAHMVDYTSAWSDAAVRRLIARVGQDAVLDLIALRTADEIGTGVPRDPAPTEEFRQRVLAELGRARAFTVKDLAIDGNDVMRALGWGPGPRIGRILHALLDEVLEDPGKNEREALLARIEALRDQPPGAAEAPAGAA